MKSIVNGRSLSLHPDTVPLLASGEPVLVGLSGGRDSVALLILLSSLEGCRPVACHIHHGIRDGSADRDALFAQRLAERLDIPYYQANVDVPAMRDGSGMSVEEAARRARQDCFRSWIGQGIGNCIALAHHRNDQAETVLMNLCRSGGGIRGMKPLGSWPGGVRVLRPLLECSREEITNFLVSRAEEWVDDETNDEPCYARNALRHLVFPRLDDIFKRDVSVPISRAARLAAEHQEAWEQVMQVLELVDPQGRLFLPKVNGFPDALKKHVVFHYMKDRGVPDLSEESVFRVLAILAADAPARTSLPCGWLASRKEKRLKLIPPVQS